MRFRRQEIYYYNTESGFETEKFAGRLLMMILEGMQEKRKTEILFLCIGTDRSTGDSLGPLIGYKLKEKGMRNARVLGTLEEPVHAMNLEPCMEQLREKCPDALVVAVDFFKHIPKINRKLQTIKDVGLGYVTLGRGPLKPGLGVSKDLDAVGDLFITGIVGSVRNGDPLMLQSVRLSVVMRLADCISRSICLGMNLLGKRVENFFGQPAPF